MTTTTEPTNDPFVKNPTEGEHTTISAEDMIHLLESLKLDTSDVELQALLLRAKNGEPIQHDDFMKIIEPLLANNAHLEELNNFEFQLH